MIFYQHFKGGIYELLTLARHSETGEPMVVYRHVWPHKQSDHVRPADLFYETLPTGQRRFRRIDKKELAYDIARQFR